MSDYPTHEHASAAPTAPLRARDFGLGVGQLPTGPHNALTDVPGVRVGHATRIEGHAIRTGLTAILPHGESVYTRRVPAAVHTINGFGKAMGFEQVRELGTLETPILLTNTLNVGRAADALISEMVAQDPEIWSLNALVGECNDSYLNAIHERVIGPTDVREALTSAHGGPVPEGCVGAGTGTSCYGFKGGIGTSSRRIGDHTLGVLLQTNFGAREELRMGGAPVGWLLRDIGLPGSLPAGSVMIVIATDAPLSARQLGRVARRAAFGLARTGTVCHHGSGDFVIAFGTTWPQTTRADGPWLDALFTAAVDSIEEAVYNALIAAHTLTGREGHTLHALPHAALRDILSRYRPDTP